MNLSVRSKRSAISSLFQWVMVLGPVEARSQKVSRRAGAVLFVLAALGKVHDQADVLQVASLRGMAHEEVLAHQELHQPHVGWNETQTRGDAFG